MKGVAFIIGQKARGRPSGGQPLGAHAQADA